MTSAPDPIRIGIPLYPNFDSLDVLGPYQVFTLMGAEVSLLGPAEQDITPEVEELWAETFKDKPRMVSPRRAAGSGFVQSFEGVKLIQDYYYTDHPSLSGLDVIFVPGALKPELPLCMGEAACNPYIEFLRSVGADTIDFVVDPIGYSNYDSTGFHGQVDADTDDDGLFDTTEVDMAMGGGCPDPLNPDSDGDTLLDGEEVALGTSPCLSDSDGDGLPDDLDPRPCEPEITTSDLEAVTRVVCDHIRSLDLDLFNGPNENANAGRRNSLANRACNAANSIARGNLDSAIALLDSLLDKIDGAAPPPDWMDESDEKAALAEDVTVLIAVLLLE